MARVCPAGVIRLALLVIASGLILSACFGGGDDDDADDESGAPTATSTRGAPTSTATSTSDSDADEYTVQPGDTLSVIAERFGLTTQELQQANGITDPNHIQVGQTLTIPQPGETTTPATTATAGGTGTATASNCDPSYPDVCIPPPPPTLTCDQIDEESFRVLAPDPHDFDPDGNGVGCEA